MGIFNLFNRDDEDEGEITTGDMLVVIEQEQKHTADIVPVTDINPERVLGGGLDRDSYSIPIEDLSVFSSPRGRVFVYNAPADLIKETKRLASLEKSIVLRQITNYKEKVEEAPTIDFKSILMVGALVLVCIILAFKS